MNRLILTGFLVFTFCALNSQVGLRGGLNYSSVQVDPGGVDFGADSKIGYHLGLQGQISIGGLNLRPALLYHNKGGREEVAGSIANSSLHYLEVPVNLAIKFGVEKLSLILEGGPYFGYLLDTTSGFVDNLDERLNKSDWGINFGVVIEMSGFGFGANYSNSLSSISKDDQVQGAFKTTNGNLALFGYMNF